MGFLVRSMVPLLSEQDDPHFDNFIFHNLVHFIETTPEKELIGL